MRRTSLILTGVLASAVLAAPGAHAATPRLSIASVTASGAKVTVKGSVSGLPARRRVRAKVALSLTDAAGQVARFSAKPGASGRFAAAKAVRFDGPLALRVRLTVAGKRVGRLLTKLDAVRIGSTSSSTPTTLIGTFKLDPGTRRPDGSHVGTYFQMFSPNGPPLRNTSSGSPDKNFTTLPPGSDGGLQTFAFQEPPAPAFVNGNSQAGRILTPQPFFNNRFGVVTAPLDPQTGGVDPLPQIVNTGGQLSGQLSAWAAQWNGASFNQGTPKPDGSYPGTTTPLRGTFNETTKRFVLSWKSLIVGGPFNNFTGAWHLEGTFVAK